MARKIVGPGSARSTFANGRPKAKYMKSATANKGIASSGIVNRNSSSVYNTGSTNNVVIKKPASLTSKIGASKPVTKRR